MGFVGEPRPATKTSESHLPIEEVTEIPPTIATMAASLKRDETYLVQMAWQKELVPATVSCLDGWPPIAAAGF
ncbi:hypothetical protein JTE90_019837 [Oedothorax gibbosus]|uniref:Uncharacterized protein n=1 Tax=Oedothorax gibbosus TaxID=931172 RepID=A0AAV6V754_9ARAC|nr:hypothetical protein JTE90_019837 [Oedothorax gibbosus]